MFKQLILASVLLSSVSAFAAAKKIEVDTSASKIVWLGKKVTGQHTGEIKFQSGHVEFDGNTFKGGEFVVDMTSISVTDITDAEMNKKLVGHFQSDDFFSVEKHKTAKFVAKSVKKVKGNTYTVTGDLSIKEATHPVTFTAEATPAGATAVVTFDRTKYDIRYGSGKFFQGLGDKMINDDVQLTVTLVPKK